MLHRLVIMIAVTSLLGVSTGLGDQPASTPTRNAENEGTRAENSPPAEDDLSSAESGSENGGADGSEPDPTQNGADSSDERDEGSTDRINRPGLRRRSRSSTSPRGPMSLDELNMSLGLDSVAERRTVRTDAYNAFRPRFAQKNKRYSILESVGLDASGSLIDEKVLLYDAMMRFGLSQEEFWESRPGIDLHRSPDGELFEYDLSMQLFPAGKVSASAFASQLNDRVPRPFLPSLDRRRERYGGGVYLNDPKLPMSLTYEHLFDDVTSRSRGLYDDEERGEDTLRYEATWNQSDAHTLNVEYEYERRNEQYSGTRNTFNTTRNYLALTDTIHFGRDNRSRIESLIRMEDEAGDLQRDSFEVSENLRLQHTESLYSTYRAQYLKESYGRLETDTYRGDVGLTHEWEDFLVSNFGAYALRRNANEVGDITEWGATADFSFTRDNRLGKFSSNLTYQHTNSRMGDGQTGGVVIDESVTFRDPLPSFLTQTRVQPFSILVRGAERGEFLVPGTDYWVFTNGDVTLLGRVPTGRIRDGDTVLVSYRYESYDDFQTSRDRVDYRVQQELLKGLDVYYAGTLQDEDVSRRRYLTYRERDINRHRVGLTYKRPRWSTGSELEYHDDNIDPYKAAHLNADLVLHRSAIQELDARGSYSYYRFRGGGYFDPRQTSLLDFGLNYRYTLSTNLEANASAMYRFQNDSLFGETNGVDITASVAYKIGKFSLLVEAEYDMLDLPSSTDNSAAIWIKLRRDIPIVERRAQR
ncbi:MAG: hypothetical protein KF841_15780 [Phycisphaerae bacterium]|nr:hypothetical protein [Phycisphaerae bacterium]